jgi:hypothetical protein
MLNRLRITLSFRTARCRAAALGAVFPSHYFVEPERRGAVPRVHEQTLVEKLILCESATRTRPPRALE